MEYSNMAGDKFADINIKWDCVNRRCRISMPGYISNLLIKFRHPKPCKHWLSPYACMPISYGAKAQLATKVDTLELLDAPHKQQVQEIVGSLLYYAHAVDNCDI